MQVQCPECESFINAPRASEVWDTFPCPLCQTELQVISDSPIEVVYADAEESDDDYDDDDFDDDDDDDF